MNMWKYVGRRHNCRGLCKGRRPRTSKKALWSINSGNLFFLILNCHSGYLLVWGLLSLCNIFMQKERCICYCMVLKKWPLWCCRSSRSCTTRNTSSLRTSLPSLFRFCCPWEMGQAPQPHSLKQRQYFSLYYGSHVEKTDIHGCPEESCQRRVACWQSTCGNGQHGYVSADLPHLLHSFANQELCGSYQGELLSGGKNIYKAV